MGGDEFVGKTLTPPKDRCRRLTQIILRYAETGRPLRVLDLGCGTGEQLFDLANVLPNARLTGVDISEANIQVAEDTYKRHVFPERINFHAIDYMKFQGNPFDLIFSWGVLHLIPVPTEALFSKIASDLTRGGLLLNAMPYACFYNRALSLVRRLLQTMRGPLTDTAILMIAKSLYRNQFSEEFLRERIHYMYHRPKRYDCRALHQFLSDACGLGIEAKHPDSRISPFQFRYRMTVFRKQ